MNEEEMFNRALANSREIDQAEFDRLIEEARQIELKRIEEAAAFIRRDHKQRLFNIQHLPPFDRGALTAVAEIKTQFLLIMLQPPVHEDGQETAGALRRAVLSLLDEVADAHQLGGRREH